MSPENSHELLQQVAAEDGETLLYAYARIERYSQQLSLQIFRMGELFSESIDDFSSFRTHAQLLASDSDFLLDTIDDAVHKVIVGYNDVPMTRRLQEVHPILFEDDKLRTHSCTQVLGIKNSESNVGTPDDFLGAYLITEDDDVMKGLDLTANDISEDVYAMIIDDYFAYTSDYIPRFITCLVLGDSSYWSDGNG